MSTLPSSAADSLHINPYTEQTILVRFASRQFTVRSPPSTFQLRISELSCLSRDSHYRPYGRPLLPTTPAAFFLPRRRGFLNCGSRRVRSLLSRSQNLIPPPRSLRSMDFSP